MNTLTNHSKTKWRTAIVDKDWRDPRTGMVMAPRPMSRFKRRRLERTPEGRAAMATMLRNQRQLKEAKAVTKEAKKRLKDAAEGR